MRNWGFLLVVVDERIGVRAWSQWPEGSFELDVRTFHEWNCATGIHVAFGHFIGFYDWLRRPDMGIIGLRFYLTEDYDWLPGALAGRSFVQQDGVVLSLFFGDDHEIDEKSSNEQNFMPTNLFWDGANGWVFVLCADDLETDEEARELITRYP